MNKESYSLPKIAYYLGYGGVLPFLGLTVIGLFGYQLEGIIGISVHTWLLFYAAIIISFIGAIHWGVVIGLGNKLTHKESSSLLIYSNIPALLAWFSFLLSLKTALFLLSFLVLLSYFIDLRLLFPKIAIHVSSKLSQDFAKLRLHLSVCVSVLLLLSALKLV